MKLSQNNQLPSVYAHRNVYGTLIPKNFTVTHFTSLHFTSLQNKITSHNMTKRCEENKAHNPQPGHAAQCVKG